MAARTFTDDHGTQWTALTVEPTWAERRAGPRRVVNLDDEEQRAFDDLGRDRRSGGDRRRGYFDVVPRVRVSSVLAGGWIAFDGGGERRRLAPIPPDWEKASDAELRELLRKATRVSARRGRLIE